MTKTQKVTNEGYRAEKRGLPCEYPGNSERERAAWEKGWRAARHERQTKQTESNK